MVILLQQRTVINAISQLLLLILICFYYANGLESLISKWSFMITYTSVILVLEIVYQFMQQTLIFKRIKTNNPDFFAKLPMRWADWQRAIGFYYLGDEKTYAFFLPYILLFAFSVLLYRELKQKLEHEKKPIDL